MIGQERKNGHEKKEGERHRGRDKKKGSELVPSFGIHKVSQQLKLWIQSQGNFLEGLGSDSEAIPPPHHPVTQTNLQQLPAAHNKLHYRTLTHAQSNTSLHRPTLTHTD